MNCLVHTQDAGLDVDIDEDNGEVELMVTNLDYNISAREWKKILFTEFQQQVKVVLQCVLVPRTVVRQGLQERNGTCSKTFAS